MGLLDLGGEHLGFEIVAAVVQVRQLGTVAPFHQHLHGAVGQLQELQDGCDRADRIKVVGVWVVDGRVLLGDQHDLVLAILYHLKRAHGLVTAHEERRHHVRKHDDVPQGQDREGFLFWH